MAEQQPTPLEFPSHFPWPIRIASIDAPAGTQVERGTRLCTYSFTVASHEGDGKPETRFGTWDSTLKGEITKWSFKPGQAITAETGRTQSAVHIKEPCTHPQQWKGMCTTCFADMSHVDYTGFSDASRATIQMTHHADGPTVSLREAQRLEKESANRLLNARKLSLIVDLDQTIVHATVDPTVGEWIAEGEAWEAAQASSSKAEDSEDVKKAEEVDEVDPNWHALKDVKMFRLAPEFFAPHSRIKGKHKARVEDEGCLYYIKPRPGWKEFLEHISSIYEMHVYTMGTRAYAEQVCAALDPDRKLFGGRILSRDESGSLSHKSLQRLFPCDQSMVVIIDDRADVWEWSPNLVKVIPYDFFIGIGDINSAFLPKLDPVLSSSPDKSSGNGKAGASPQNSPDPTSVVQGTISLDPIVTEDAKAIQDAADDAVLEQATHDLDVQVEERPLAKKLEELEAATDPTKQAEGSSNDVKAEQPDSEDKQEEVKKKPVRKALLNNNDYELHRVGALLDRIHTTFYTAYDGRDKRKGKVHSDNQKPYDIRNIIPPIRSAVLAGVNLVFSSVIPLDSRPQATEIWRTARMFGAQCSTELLNETTHVIAAKRGTAKVDAARRRGNIQIVWLEWFLRSIALWQRQREDMFLLEPSPGRAPKGDAKAGGASVLGPDADREADELQVGSSDLDVDTDDLDDDDEPDSTPSTPSKRRNKVRFAEGGVASGSALPTGTSTPLNEPLEALTGDIDWAALDAEVEAGMNESDSEEGGSERGGMDTEDDNASITSTSVTINADSSRRKRLRSLTPSEVNGMNGQPLSGDDDNVSSPIAKRKKVAASPLKQALTVGASPSNLPSTPNSRRSSISGSPNGSEIGDMGDMEDFLAGELEEWS